MSFDQISSPQEEPVIRQLEAQDVEQLTPIIETWVRDPETNEILRPEVEEITSNMRESITGERADRQYLVAEYMGKIVGMMGIALPTELMQEHATTSNPLEIINAFVSRESRVKGIGSRLLANTIDLSRFVGASELMVNSGPRYKDTAWNFYDRRFGGRRTTLKDHYGPGKDAPVWSMPLQAKAQKSGQI